MFPNDNDASALSWWKANTKFYPLLSQVACYYLVIFSTEDERMGSSCLNMVDERNDKCRGQINVKRQVKWLTLASGNK